MRAYLDTNVLYSFLKKKIEEKISGNNGRGLTFTFLGNTGIVPLTSFLTLIELVDVLKREMNVNKRSLENFVETEITNLKIKLIEETKIDDNVFKWYLKGLELEDAIHLNAAKENNLILITNDISLLKFAKSVGVESLTIRDLKEKLSNYF